MWKLSVLLVSIYLLGSVAAAEGECPSECVKANCSAPPPCLEKVLDKCDCCAVCALQQDDTCGTEIGRCGRKFKCRGPNGEMNPRRGKCKRVTLLEGAVGLLIDNLELVVADLKREELNLMANQK